MILFVNVLLKDVFEQGRNFQWPIPSSCPRCNHYKVWRHGFVERFFDTFAEVLLIRRFQCPNCHCVICYRPDSHFSRIQATKLFVRQCLKKRISSGLWPSSLSKSRYRHWLTNLKRKASAYFAVHLLQDLIAAYDRLLALGHIPISCSV
jgi:transposase-like protein